jgi:hypothetical protein
LRVAGQVVILDLLVKEVVVGKDGTKFSHRFLEAEVGSFLHNRLPKPSKFRKTAPLIG